jgi:ferritin-like metal-binding protein YciE
LALNTNPTLQRCQAIEQLIQDVESTIENTKFGTIRDAGILLSLQKIEHYEIAAYSILSTYAESSNENAIAELLAISLNEEKVTELRLEKISNSIRFDS